MVVKIIEKFVVIWKVNYLKSESFFVRLCINFIKCFFFLNVNVFVG